MHFRPISTVRAAALSLPLFPEVPGALKAPPLKLADYQRDDEVWLWPSGVARPRVAARVIAVLPRHHELTLRTADDRIVTLNPIVHGGMIRKRNTA